MPPSNVVVVDGSNIATEGRTTPSLEQLDQAVRQYLDEHPGANVTVVVDASFGHRIEPAERAAFEQAVAHGELVSPPAGAIGRGDAFLLRIAERIGARVLSNDSFREFHEEHPWLFDEDRLVGGTPVPGVGWIFTPRRPVRGPLTPAAAGGGRRGTRKGADKGQPGDGDEETPPEAGKGESKQADVPKPKKSRSRGSRAAKASDREAPDGKVQAAIAQATEEALTPGSETKKETGQKRPKTEAAPDAVNDPLPFITFASEHPVGYDLQGTVVSFTSHGAMAQVEDMLCYVPLAGLGDPPPRRARDVLRQGEIRTFQLVALDPARRGAQLALPEVVAMHGEIAEGAEEAASEVRRRRRKRASPSSRPTAESGASRPNQPSTDVAGGDGPASVDAGPKKSRSRRESVSEVRTASARPRGAKSATRAKKVMPIKKTAPAKKTAPVKKAALVKKTAPARKTAPVKKVAEKAPSPKPASPKPSSGARASSPKKAPGSGKTSTTRKVPSTGQASARTTKAPTMKAPAKKAGATKPTARKAAAAKSVSDKSKKTSTSQKKS